MKIYNNTGWVILAVVLLLSMAAVGGFRLHQIEDTGQFGQVVKSQGGAGLVFADDADTDDQTLAEVTSNGNQTTDDVFFNGSITSGPTKAFIKNVSSRKKVGYDILNFEPVGTGYLILSYPEALNLQTYYFDIEISGFGYSSVSRGFTAKMQGLKFGSNDLVYQSSFSIQGTMPGGIKSCIYQGKPGFILGDGTVTWSLYDILEIKRLSTRTNDSNEPNFHNGWSSAVVSDLSAVTLSQTGTVTDQTPYSSVGVSFGNSGAKAYRNLICDRTNDGDGYVVLKMSGSTLGNFVNGTITIADYVTQNLERVATINFNLLGNTGELARYARIEGTFGSDKVAFYVDPNGDNYIVLGDGSDSWSTLGQVCLDRLTVNGNQAGEYGSKVSYQIYTTNDVSGLELVPVTVVQNSGDQTLSVSGNQLTLSGQGGGSVTMSGDNLGNHTATQNLLMGGNFIQRTAASDESIRLTSENVTFTGDFGGNYAVWLFSNHLDMPKVPNATNFPTTERGMKVFWKEDEVVDGEDRNRLYIHTEEDRTANTSGDAKTYKIVTEQDFVQRSSMRTADILRTSGSFDTQLRTDIPFAGTYMVHLHLVFRSTIAGGGVGWAIVATNLVNANSYFTRQDQFAITSDWTTLNFLNAAGNVVDTNVALDYTGVMEFSAPTTVNITTGTNGVGNTTYAKGCYLTFTKIN
jgi:hypothetical protein